MGTFYSTLLRQQLLLYVFLFNLNTLSLKINETLDSAFQSQMALLEVTGCTSSNDDDNNSCQKRHEGK